MNSLFIKKLLQYHLKYEEITRIILTQSERKMVDKRLSALEKEYKKHIREKSEAQKFLASIPNFELS